MLDFSRAALAAKAEPVPAGTYDLKIATAEATTSGSGHTSLMIGRDRGWPAPGPQDQRQPDADQHGRAAPGRADQARLAGPAQILDAIGASDEEREAASADLMQLGRLLKGRTVRVTTGITVDQRDGTRREIIVKVSRARSTRSSRSSASRHARDPRPRGLGGGDQAPPSRAGGRGRHRGLPHGREPLGPLPARCPRSSGTHGMMREIPMDTCLLRGEPAAFVPPGSLTRRRLGETLLDRPTELVIYDMDNLPIPAGARSHRRPAGRSSLCCQPAA